MKRGTTAAAADGIAGDQQVNVFPPAPLLLVVHVAEAADWPGQRPGIAATAGIEMLKIF